MSSVISTSTSDMSSSKDSMAAQPNEPHPVSNVSSDTDNLELGIAVQTDQEKSLPRADGGKEAWLFLAGCFVLEALVWGFPFSFGVFQSFYTTHPPFSTSSGIAIIGTCSTGVMYFFAPISLYALEVWPSTRRACSIVGLLVVVSALISSSFATQVWHLILFQGILYGIGGSALYSPTMFYLDEWFIHRKGLAFGVMWAGVGTSGLVFPFLLTALLDKYGFRITLRIWAFAMAILCAPLIYFIKERLPPPSAPLPRQPISYSFLKSRVFIFLQLANILESLGFFLPSIYLPSYANSIGLSSVASTIILALLNASSVVGAISMGQLCDHLHVTTVITISTVGSTLSVFLLWGLATNLPLLVLFSIIYGVFAGGFSAIWTGMMKEVQKNNTEAKLGTLMGLFSAGRGIGAILSGPLSGLLLGSSLKGTLKFGYGAGGYGALILFTGVSAFLGIISVGAKRKLT